MSDSVTPWTVAHQAPLSMEFSRQEYWSGLPCPPPGDVPDPRIEPASITSLALAGRFITTSDTREAECLFLDDNKRKNVKGNITASIGSHMFLCQQNIEKK